MNTIDHRHRYGIMLDTETANTLVDENGKLNMDNVLPYDFGFAVIDSKGNVYETFSFINADIYLDEPELMSSAYYANKIPLYEAELAAGLRILATTYTIRQTLLNKIKEYNCIFVCAHNMRFDLKACNNIQRWTTKSKYRYFFPYGIEFWDTLKAARQVIGKMPTYKKFCIENNYLTANNQPQFTAEILYRFITKDNTFKEDHTGLEDVLIEVEILKYIRRQHKKMNIKMFTKS